jgi:glutathione synthase/RimK-type ligase-like ATP-grasp enzyme
MTEAIHARLALATDAAHAGLTDDDIVAIAPLRARGVHAEPAVWSDASVRWDAYDGVVVRSCWDYHRQLDTFLAWIDRLERLGVRVWNPPDVLRWNTRKTYLRDLAAAGVPTVPTAWPNEGDSLVELLAARGWRDAVVKPVVSASAFRTWRVRAAEASSREGEFRDALTHGAVMVQPFLEDVVRTGEWSLVFLGGAFSHAALKRPRPGDFRVQAEHGGSSTVETPDERLVAEAASIVDRYAAGCLYARVDGVVVDGSLQLMELELVEPSLFLGLTGSGAERFAEVVAAAIGPMQAHRSPN